MKLIIDIPDCDYEYIRNNCIVPIKYDNHIYEAIRSGTPYEERPKGKWITHKFNYFIFEECDQCHCKVGTINMKFCPNCGSDNREDGE